MNETDEIIVFIKSGHRPNFYKHIQVRFKYFKIGRFPCFKARAAWTSVRRALGPMIILEAFMSYIVFKGWELEYLVGRLVRIYYIEFFVMDRNHVGDRMEGLLPILP